MVPSAEHLTLQAIFPYMIVIAAVSFLTRSIVFYGFKRLAEWPSFQALGTQLPSCALLILAIYALRSTLGDQPGSFWAIVLGLVVLTAVHLIFKRIILSLLVSMASVILLVQFLPVYS